MSGDGVFGSGPTAPHEDLPVDPRAARAAFRSAVRYATVAAIGGFLFGYDISTTNRAVKALQADFHIGNALLGFAAASVVLGAAVGAVWAGRIGDRLGRLSMMKLSAASFFVCGLGAGLATSIWMFIVFHFIGGIGIGFSSVAAPAYIAEISPPRFRGRLGSLQQLAIVIGLFGAMALTWVPFHIAGGASKPLWLGLAAWRWTFLGELILALLYFALLFTISESPRYLVGRQEISQARQVLGQLLGPRDVEVTITRIASSLEQEKPQSWRDLRKPTGGLYGIVWVGLGLAVFQQFVGINVIFSYSDLLWEAVGFGEKSSFTIALVTTGVNVLITLVAIALIAADLFVVAFAVSWGPVLWVLLGEMFPNRIRSAALGLASGVQWMANWTIAVTFPALRHALVAAYGFYALCAVLSLVFVWRWVRETNGVSLEDMPDEAAPATGSPAAA